MISDDARTDVSSTLPGYAAVVGAAALWAVAAVVARRLFDDGISAVELTESRALVAAVGFALVPGAWRSRSGRTGANQLVALGIALALVNVTYYVAISRIPVAVALVIQYTAPALVVGWASAVSRRAPPFEVLVALFTALVGVVLVVELASGALGRMDAVGIATGVASAVFFAAYTVLAERTGAVYGSSGAMLRGFAVASALWVAFQVPRGFPSELVEPANLPEVLYVGVAGTLAPFFLFAWGVARVRAERAAIAATLEPVVAAVVAWVWLGQNLSASQLVGGALVISAVAFLQVREKQPVVAPDL
ncbi:MAG: EamA family transporter [Actinomycetota bacterium]|nr:EamA family transporter [Actinomycetota bacterium]